MTDLRTTCPHCGKAIYQYHHLVDNFGMSKALPNGIYEVTCAEGYGMEDTPYCGHKFAVRVGQTIEIVQ